MKAALWQNSVGAACIIVGLFLFYLLWVVWPIDANDPVVGQLPPCGVASTSMQASMPSPTSVAHSESKVSVSSPATVAVNANPGWNPCIRSLFGHDSIPVPADLRLLMIVAITAAIGSFVQVATSFATFVGNNKFSASWVWWYVLRAPIGIALAYVFYFAIRGGILTPSQNTGNINVWGIATIAGVVGLFSKQASDKLYETFTTLFRTAPNTGDALRNDKLKED